LCNPNPLRDTHTDVEVCGFEQTSALRPWKEVTMNRSPSNMLRSVVLGLSGGSCDHDNELLILQNFTKFLNGRATIKKDKVHPCTGTEALYRPYDL
jgi:uncharacterized ferredoxin-like protein